MPSDIQQFAFLHPLCRMFRSIGYEIHLVGGCVRDYVLGHKVKDFDLCTNARPSAIEIIIKMVGGQLVEKKGGNFGTVHCRWEGEDIEITTYRLDKKYNPGSRRPEVEFADKLEDDLIRRDFTINSMVMHEIDGLDREFSFNKIGLEDLRESILRAPRDPNIMFEEDPLRILRMYRFAHRFSFEVEPSLRQAARNYAPHLKTISKERIHDELINICSRNNAGKAIREMVADGAALYVLYGLHHMLGTEPNGNHGRASKGIWRPDLEHIVAVIEKVQSNGGSYLVVLAVLFALSRGGMDAQRELGELKFSNFDIKAVKIMSTQVKWVMDMSQGEGDSWTDENVRMLINHAKGWHCEVILLAMCDRDCRNIPHLGVDFLSEKVHQMPRDVIESLVNPKSPLTGEDLRELLGIQDGPAMGIIIKELTQMTIAGTISSKQDAIDYLMNKN